MKKFISLFLIIISTVSISSCGCTKNSPGYEINHVPIGEMRGEYTEYSREDMTEAAIEISGDALSKEAFKNPDETSEKYEGKVLKITSTVRKIEDDKVIISERMSDNGIVGAISVYLEPEDLKKLNVNDEITVIGGINDITSIPALHKAFLVEE